jgi:hypothetical protein
VNSIPEESIQDIKEKNSMSNLKTSILLKDLFNKNQSIMNNYSMISLSQKQSRKLNQLIASTFLKTLQKCRNLKKKVLQNSKLN